MKVSFIATIQGRAWHKGDDDGSCEIKFTTDGTQLPQVLKLYTMMRKGVAYHNRRGRTA